MGGGGNGDGDMGRGLAGGGGEGGGGIGGGGNGGGGVGSAGSITNTPTPTIVKPTAATTETFLTKSAGGIKAVTIDHKDGIKNYIDRTADYDGIF